MRMKRPREKELTWTHIRKSWSSSIRPLCIALLDPSFCSFSEKIIFREDEDEEEEEEN
jgi:hypothetical protein